MALFSIKDDDIVIQNLYFDILFIWNSKETINPVVECATLESNMPEPDQFKVKLPYIQKSNFSTVFHI